MTREEKKVILASSAGTIFEWYDFYLYGSLAAIIGAQFFSAFPEATRNVFALLAFAAGFLVRPFGALVFGRLGDLVGRKYTFLMTILIMGVSTFVVGLLPTYDTIGVAAPIILIALRMLQGLALGGEYGGAAIYVAEHAPHGRRGYLHLLHPDHGDARPASLVAACVDPRRVRAAMARGEAKAFNAWGWRIPFLLSIFLLGISLYIRLQMNESPAFKKMKEEGTAVQGAAARGLRPVEERQDRPHRAARPRRRPGGGLVHGPVLRAVLPAERRCKVDSFTANVLIAWSLILGTGGFVFFGSLSDRIGRKPIILAGCLIAALTYFPVFKLLTRRRRTRRCTRAADVDDVVVVADPATARSSSTRRARRSSPAPATSPRRCWRAAR